MIFECARDKLPWVDMTAFCGVIMWNPLASTFVNSYTDPTCDLRFGLVVMSNHLTISLIAITPSTCILQIGCIMVKKDKIFENKKKMFIKFIKM